MNETRSVGIIEPWLAILFFLVLGLSVLTACGPDAGPGKEKETSSAVKDKEHQEEREAGLVTLSVEKQKLAGIAVKTMALEEVSAPLSATAVIELNADRVSKVSSRVDGENNQARWPRKAKG